MCIVELADFMAAHKAYLHLSLKCAQLKNSLQTSKKVESMVI